MNKAVITTGGKQYLVSEGDTVDVELLKSKDKKITLEPLLTIIDDKISVGSPVLDKIKVSAEILNDDHKADKVTAIRYKAKKRVHKVHGHRQHFTTIKITKIS